MKRLLTPSRILAAVLLLGSGVQLGAQSLGSARAEAWIGRPFEMTVPARIGSGEGDECIRAEVWYGDTRLGDGQVRTSVIGPEGQRRVRVEAQPAVDEPIVTVQLRAGCRNTMTRSYTLLPEYPTEQMLASAPLPGVARPPLAASPALVAQAAGAAPRALPRATLASAREATERPARARSVVHTAQRAPRPEAAGRPRLRLDLWEPDAHTMLRVSAQLSEPTQDAARRATAALLWKAINADPQELLRTTAMLQKLEGDLAQLRQTSGQTRAELAALRQRLEAPQPAFLSPRLVQLLTLLLLAASAVAGFLWWRNSRNQPERGAWYAPTDALQDPILPPVQEPAQPAVARTALEPETVASPAAEAGPMPQRAAAGVAPMAPSVVAPRAAPAPAPVSAQPSNMIDFDLPVDAVRAQAQAAAAAPARLEAGGLMRVETLAATFDEVEFLASLGLWSDAMDVLKTYLQDSSAPAPIAFWELIRLSAQADDAAGGAAVRKRYMQLFGIAAPKLDRIGAPLGLESHPNLSEELVRSWGRPEALGVIEYHLFDVPAPDRAFTLQAGRDLLVLHDLALTLLRESGAQAPGEALAGHAMAPWAHLEDPQQAQAAAQAAADVGGAFALDLDLDAPAQPLPEPESVPEVQAANEEDPMVAELQALADRNAAAKAREDEDLFSAAVALETMRRPTKR
jgi:hypothetical protein